MKRHSTIHFLSFHSATLTLAHRTILLSCFLSWICFSWNASAQANVPIDYRESLRLEWGTITWTNPVTGPVTESSWYTRTPPSFAEAGIFKLSQQGCLKSCFEILKCSVTADNTIAFRIGPALHGDFARETVEQRCLVQRPMFLGALPAPWRDGSPRTTNWTFRFRSSIALGPGSPTDPSGGGQGGSPGVEVVLLSSGVNRGEVLEVRPSELGAMEELRTQLGMAPSRATNLSRCDAWLRLFLVSPVTLSNRVEPTPLPVSLLRPGMISDVQSAVTLHRAALTHGLAVVEVVGRVLGEARTDTRAHFDALTRELQGVQPPGHVMSRLSGFTPVSGESRQALGLTANRIVGLRDRGVDIRFATATNTSDVTRSGSVWNLKLGPFVEWRDPAVRVQRVKGKDGVLSRQELEAKLAERRESFTNYLVAMGKLEERLKNKLHSAPSEFSTRGFWLPDVVQAHGKAMQRIRTDRYVYEVQSRWETNRMVYDVAFAPTLFEGDVGVEYEPGHGLGAQAGVRWERLWKSSDTFHLEATVSQRALKGELDYQLRYWESIDQRTQLGWMVFGNAGRDDRYRLGGLGASPFEHDDREGGVGHRLEHGWDRLKWRMEDRVSVWSTELSGAAANRPVRDGTGLVYRHDQAWQWSFGGNSSIEGGGVEDLAPGSGRGHPWILTLGPRVAIGPGVGFRNDDWFWTAELRAKVEREFGGVTGDLLYASLETSVGGASRDIPDALQWRLGDEGRMLGLESGEFSGRSFVHVAGSMGVSLGGLISRWTKKSEEDATGGGGGAGVGAGEMLKSLYVSVVGEVATMHGVLSGRVISDPDETLSSVGVALELRPGAVSNGVGFRLGYGYSPGSFRRSGRMFTSVVWSF